MVAVFRKVFFLVGSFLISKLSWLLAWGPGFVSCMINGVVRFLSRPCFLCSLLVLRLGLLLLLLVY